MITLRHLGESGLRLGLGGVEVDVDPPRPGGRPVVLTWSEQERLGGARAAVELAAAPELLRHLGRAGVPLIDGVQVAFAGLQLLPSAFPPIPYAVPAEALRKSLSALRRPAVAVGRLRHTLRRPPGPPLAVELRAPGLRVVLLQQALHRFTPAPVLRRLVERHGGADLLVAGTDYQDEQATGRLLRVFEARRLVLADLVGPVRRKLGLPVRPLAVAQAEAPAGTRTLEEGEALTWEDEVGDGEGGFMSSRPSP